MPNSALSPENPAATMCAVPAIPVAMANMRVGTWSIYPSMEESANARASAGARSAGRLSAIRITFLLPNDAVTCAQPENISATKTSKSLYHMNLEFKPQPREQYPQPDDPYFSFYQRGGMIAYECAREYAGMDQCICNSIQNIKIEDKVHQNP